MFKIINNKQYNTASAHEVASWDNKEYGLDAVEETLYLKKTGEFFLHGSGGARSRYAEPSGSGGWSGGEKIIPLTLDVAREWVKRNCAGQVYEDLFGEASEPDAVLNKPLSVLVSDADRTRLCAYKARTGKTNSEIIHELIDTL